ncbi:hypothetical protein GGR52DRAFT_475341 [Hypoxylon sp. FL1284]|nr:hypothetical protein GGR52DRAFT_475341 [Hypoxylon sp. FL1284]
MPTMRRAKASLKSFKKFLSRKANRVDSTVSSTPEEDASSSSSSSSSSKGKKQLAAAPEPPEECPICHDPVGLANPEGLVEAWTKLYCGHRFGTRCIQTWLQESVNRDPSASPSCPICRATAKHPCGHLVSPPLFPAYHLSWQAPRTPPSPPLLQRVQPQPQPPARRRLTRRPGHPLRPPPAEQQSQPQRLAQVVGECRTCAENAEFAARVRRLREQQRREREAERRPTAPTTVTTTTAGSRSAAAIKSIIPGLKRSTHTVRTTVVHMGVDPRELLRRADDDDEVEAGPSRASCYGNTTHVSTRGVVRRPTPPPSYSSRRLSI